MNTTEKTRDDAEPGVPHIHLPAPLKADKDMQKEFAGMINKLSFSPEDLSIKLGNSREKLLIIRVLPEEEEKEDKKSVTYKAEFCVYKHNRPVEGLSFKLVNGKDENIYQTAEDGMFTVSGIQKGNEFRIEVPQEAFCASSASGKA